jgi:putative thioredoxin
MPFNLQDFQKDVVEASETQPVVIDFWADWCGPCKQLGPILEKLANEAKGRWKLVKIDTEKDPELAMQFNVRGIPAVKMVYQRKLIAEFTGAQPEHVVRKWLDENLPETDNEDDEILSEATKLISRGERTKAHDLLKSHLSDDSSDAIFARYAMLCLPDDIAEASEYLKKVSDIGKYSFEFEALDTIKQLKELSKTGKLSSDNEKALQDYKSGIKSLFDSDFEKALEHFLQALTFDRSIDGDGPRKACLASFKLLGEIHPLTMKYRRRFSMALY